MFGFINANTNALSEEDKAIYQSFYCGVCRELKKRGGKRCEILLNYDSVFLSLLLSGLYEPLEKNSTFTCGMHPFKKKTAEENEFISYAADIDIILSYQSLKDKVHDGAGPAVKRLLSSLSDIYETARNKYERQALAAEECIEKTTAAENEKEKDVDLLSSFTGDMLAEVFVMKKDEFSDRLYECGYWLGKYVYLLDAYNDFLGDRSRKRYNPLVEAGYTDLSKMTDFVKPLLTAYITECTAAFEKLPVITYAGIIRNILYSGVWSRFDIAEKRYLSKK